MENIITTAFYTELLDRLSEDNLTHEELEWIHDHLMNYAMQVLVHAGDELIEECREDLKIQKEYENSCK